MAMVFFPILQSMFLAILVSAFMERTLTTSALTDSTEPSGSCGLTRSRSERNNSIRGCGTMRYLGSAESKKFYYDVDVQLNWFDAWEYCRSLGLHLGAIDNRDEQTFINSNLPSHAYYWNSGNDLGAEGNFFWMASGQQIVFTNFFPNEPNNHDENEHCVDAEAHNRNVFMWNDLNCYEELQVLCQYDAK